jgi:hypothetical protein
MNYFASKHGAVATRETCVKGIVVFPRKEGSVLQEKGRARLDEHEVLLGAFSVSIRANATPKGTGM